VGFSTEQKRERIKHIVGRITIHTDNIEIGLTEAGGDLFVDAAPSGAIRSATVMKAGVGGRQIASRDIASAGVDRSLVKAIAWVRDLRRRLERDGKPLDELAREDGCSRPYVSSMIRLAYLAPGITQSILQGTQPAQLTLADLMQRDIPADWSVQRRAFVRAAAFHCVSAEMGPGEKTPKRPLEPRNWRANRRSG
jgi:hypothetical protein